MAKKLDKSKGEIERNRPLKDLFAPRLPGDAEEFTNPLQVYYELGGKPERLDGEPYPYTMAKFYREAEFLDFSLVLSRLREFEQERPDWLASEKLGDRASNEGRFQQLSELLASIDHGLEQLDAAPAALSDLLVLVAQAGYLAGAIDFRYAEFRLSAGRFETSGKAKAAKDRLKNIMREWLKGKIKGMEVKKHGKGYVLAYGNEKFCRDAATEAMTHREKEKAGRWLTEESAANCLLEILPGIIKDSQKEGGQITP